MRYLIGIAAVLGVLLLPVQHAFACSGIPPTLADHAASAEIVAIGALANANEDTVTLQVEERLKGATDTTELVVNNHYLPNDSSCRMSLGKGGRFTEGMRVLAFLQQDEFGVADWRPIHGGRAIYRIDGDVLRHADSDGEFDSLETARATIAEVAGADSAIAGAGSTGSTGRQVKASGAQGPTEPHAKPAAQEGVPTATPAPPPPPPAQPQPAPPVQVLPAERVVRDGIAVVRPGVALPPGGNVQQGAATMLDKNLPTIFLAFFTGLSALLLLWALVQVARKRQLR